MSFGMMFAGSMLESRELCGGQEVVISDGANQYRVKILNVTLNDTVYAAAPVMCQSGERVFVTVEWVPDMVFSAMPLMYMA